MDICGARETPEQHIPPSLEGTGLRVMKRTRCLYGIVPSSGARRGKGSLAGGRVRGDVLQYFLPRWDGNSSHVRTGTAPIPRASRLRADPRGELSRPPLGGTSPSPETGHRGGGRGVMQMNNPNLMCMRCYYISQDHGMVWVGRDLTDHPVPPPRHGQGPLPPAQGAPSPIQPGLEPCQGGGSHSFSGQPGPGPHHPQREEFLPYIQPESPLFQLEAVTPWPITPRPCHSPSPALLQPLQALAAALRSPQSLLLSRLSSPSSPSLSSQQKGSSPQITAVGSSSPAPPAPGLSCAEGSRAGCRTPRGVSPYISISYLMLIQAAFIFFSLVICTLTLKAT